MKDLTRFGDEGRILGEARVSLQTLREYKVWSDDRSGTARTPAHACSGPLARTRRSCLLLEDGLWNKLLSQMRPFSEQGQKNNPPLKES